MIKFLHIDVQKRNYISTEHHWTTCLIASLLRSDAVAWIAMSFVHRVLDIPYMDPMGYETYVQKYYLYIIHLFFLVWGI